MKSNKKKVIKSLLKNIQGTTNAMEGHRVQHETIERTTKAIRDILDEEE